MNESNSAAQRSEQLFNQGWHCAESVLLAVAEQRGIRSEFLPGIATGFCSGTSRTAGLCGAVAGGVLAIGLLIGRHGPDEGNEHTYAAVREFLAAFEARFGSTNCFQLTGCRLDTPDGRRCFKENGVRDKKCRHFAREAAGMALAACHEVEDKKQSRSNKPQPRAKTP